MNISPVDTNSGKSEEIEVLNKIAERIALPGSYLKMLFTDSLVQWVTDQIKIDGNPDIVAELYSERDNTAKLSSACSGYQTTIKLMQAGFERSMKETQDKYDGIVTLRDNHVTQLISDRGAAFEEYRKISLKLDEDKAEIRLLSARIENGNNEIIRLKALLFDAGEAYKSLEAGGNFPIDAEVK